MSKLDKDNLAAIKARAKVRAREKQEENNLLLRECMSDFAKSLSEANQTNNFNQEPMEELKAFLEKTKKGQAKK